MSSNFGVGGAAFRTVKDQKILVESVAFPAYTRRAIEKAGLFDEELVRNQDDEYNYRLRELGGCIVLCPDIHSRYYSRSSFRSLWRQYLQYGYWKVRVMQKHPRRMRLRQFAPPLFVAGLLFSLLVAPLIVGWWPLGLLAVSYIVANLGSTFLSAREASWRMLPLLPLAFITLHLAYGSGFLFGLIRFWRRWAIGIR
jgi:cellulose synthase/poly-beta-1,6-N-acetylglucosamine synthase-like glycosyltransferase